MSQLRNSNFYFKNAIWRIFYKPETIFEICCDWKYYFEEQILHTNIP